MRAIIFDYYYILCRLYVVVDFMFLYASCIHVDSYLCWKMNIWRSQNAVRVSRQLSTTCFLSIVAKYTTKQTQCTASAHLQNDFISLGLKAMLYLNKKKTIPPNHSLDTCIPIVTAGRLGVCNLLICLMHSYILTNKVNTPHFVPIGPEN